MFLIDDLVNGIFNWDKTNQNIYAQKKINRETNESNEAIAKSNLKFQRENLDYQKAIQQQIFAREDTAHQREIQDLRNAGINPLATATGGTGAGAGAVVNTQALNNGMQYQSTQLPIGNPMSINLDGLAQLKMSRDTLNAQAEAQDKTLTLDYAKLKQDETERHLDRLVEIQKLEAQTDDWRQKNELEKERNQIQKMVENNMNELRKTQERLNKANAEAEEYETSQWKKRGGTKNDSTVGKTTSDIFGRFADAVEGIKAGTKGARQKAKEVWQEMMNSIWN